MTLPKEFEDYTRKLMGDKLYDTLKHGLEEEASTSIRINPCKDPTPFPSPTGRGDAIPWCKDGFYLKERPAFTFDPLLHAGLYYVQESSSMFVCEVVRQLIKEPVMMLDLCAAPGGKTTALRSVLPEGSLLFSNEPVKTRASILKENVIKFGHPDVIVTNNYPKDYRKAKLSFDAILADVPCSGEGMFRKDPNSITEWSPSNVEKCWQLQRSIIEDIWPCLKPGGILIYSTCTFNAHEDEENVAWIAENLGADFVTIDTKPKWNITGSLIDNNPVCRFIPGKTKGEGLFLAVLRKHRGDAASASNTSSRYSNAIPNVGKGKRSTQKTSSPQLEQGSWLQGTFDFIEDKDIIRDIPSSWFTIYNNVKSKLHIIHAGVGIGTRKGKAIIPDASLALSTALNTDAFPHADLNYADAIRFLRREAVTLPPDTPKGFVLITYKGHPLGFEKNIGNRANNLYPQEWRIKSTHVSQEEVVLL